MSYLKKMYYNITDGNNIDWMKAFHMVNVYMWIEGEIQNEAF